MYAGLPLPTFFGKKGMGALFRGLCALSEEYSILNWLTLMLLLANLANTK